MFNLLGVLALPGLIRPADISDSVLTRDFPVMIGLTVLLWLKARGFRAKSRLTRFNGIVLVSLYVGYIAWLFYETLS
jgi:cation:H+ antiporter